ncbi:hypothetical protein LZ31DRAFT_557344 [Colletotrichum somersetense]|nr:hypothetical protein LZ31DRAFT_557344 [Colletotrichum somersetense]
MTPSAGQNSPKPGLSAHSQRSEDIFNDFVSFISRFCTDKSFQDMKAKIEGYNTLQKKLDDAETTYHKNLKELLRLTADWKDEKEGFEKKIKEQTEQHGRDMDDKAAAHRKLKAEQDSTTTLKGKIKFLEEEVGRTIATSKKHEANIAKLESTMGVQAKDLESAKKKAAELRDELQSATKQLNTQSEALERAKGQLATFRSYIATLVPLKDMRVEISEILDSSFKDALALFRAFLGRDFDRDRLQDSKFWDRVRDHVAIHRTIPLPASNSADAKQMRAAAGLAIYSRALEKYVLRPTYLSLGTDAEDVLDELPAVDSFQDALVRAVLLKVLPDQQNARRDACANRVVDEVLSAVAGWVPTDQHAPFKSQLGRLTSLLCSSWQRVQRVHERVESTFTFGTPTDWQLLPSWIDTIPSDNNSRTAPPLQGDKERPPRHRDLEPAPLSVGDVPKVVWPAFIATSPEQSVGEQEGAWVLVHHGFVLTRANIRGAATEESQARAGRKPTRDSNAPAQRGRRDSAVFLSHGASDGLIVK